MAQINKPGLHFNTVTYVGNGSTTQTITGVGFQPDWSWIKNRSANNNHNMYDVVRGQSKRLKTNTDEAEIDIGADFTFQSDGFYVGNRGDTNGNGNNIVGWNWKAGGSGSANSDGDIASTVSANTTAGFSIVKWTSNGSDSDGIGHGLGVAPKIIIYKRTDGSGPWYWVYKYVDDTLDYLILSGTNAKADLTLGTYGFSTSTTFTNLGFGNTHQLIAYCFAEKKGYSKFGNYTGNGDANGTFIYTGFKPSFVIFKVTNDTDNWHMHDLKRTTNGGNPLNKVLYPNLNNSEGSVDIDFYSNGFKPRSNNNAFNASGKPYIYMAFAENPIVGTNNIPAVGE